MREKNSESLSVEADRSAVRFTQDIDACVNGVLEALGKHLVLALPLGLGKANHIANAFFARAQADPSISLHIITALTLEVPRTSDVLGRRFLEPLVQRLYADYPELEYAMARRQNKLPKNVRVSEFFLSPGKLLHTQQAQQQYMSSNYTHAVRDLASAGVNVIAQMIAPHPEKDDLFSLSCNPDVTLELISRLKASKKRFITIGQVNKRLPFMPNDAVVSQTTFDWIVRSSEGLVSDFPLFAVPKLPVSLAEYAIAIHVTSLVKDGGTLQIGIGSLGDAVTHMLTLRHNKNEVYAELLRQLVADSEPLLRPKMAVESDPFETGLYAASEMLVDGLLVLREAGILKRNVFADETLQQLINSGAVSERINPELIRALIDNKRISPQLSEADVSFMQRFGIIREGWRWREDTLIPDNGSTDNNTALSCNMNDANAFKQFCEHSLGEFLENGFYCHGGFYVGSNALYQRLAKLSKKDAAGINMCGVEFINALYGQESLKRAQRIHARFINSAMKATLVGDVVADGTENHQVVSGVGGQYNFIAQAHELENGRAIICLPSTRTTNGRVESNIVWEYAHTTIPRHLRDTIVTEYGAADIRGLCDRDVIIKMLAICDSRFQEKLLTSAKKAGKIEQDFELPSAFTDNSPTRLARAFANVNALPHLPYYPLGTDFTEEEAVIAVALKTLKENKGSMKAMTQLIITGCAPSVNELADLQNKLARMQLAKRLSMKEHFLRWALVGALRHYDSRRPITA